MGLNDFIQRLATNSYACKQWVPSDSCYCYSLEGQRHWVTQPEMPVICPLRTFCGLMWLPHQVIHIKVSTLCLFFYSPEVQSILNLSPPQEAELMNTNPSPPVSIFAFSLLYLQRCACISSLYHAFCGSYYGSSFSSSLPLSQPSPSQQINLGPSSNPSAKPSDFHFLKVIGKGSFGKVLLARHRTDDQFYAVKVLQKKAILKKKEVNTIHTQTCLRQENALKYARKTKCVNLSTSLIPRSLTSSGETHHVREECAAKECQAPVSGWPALFFPNSRQALLRVGLHQWRRGELLAELLPRKDKGGYEAEMIEEKGQAGLFKEGAKDEWIG